VGVPGPHVCACRHSDAIDAVNNPPPPSCIAHLGARGTHAFLLSRRISNLQHPNPSPPLTSIVVAVRPVIIVGGHVW
jgi:hypothetical protein